MLFYVSSLAQGLINKGAGIVVKSGAHVVVNGNFLNKIGTQDGFVKLDGKLIVKGDVINNATNEIFIIPTTMSDGWLVMPSGGIQKFRGTSTLRVNNLELSGGTKRLDMAEVKVVGDFKLAAVLELNTHVFHLENSDPTSLIHQNGYIKAETTPQEGLGYVRWDIANEIGRFIIPFGSGNEPVADESLELIIRSPGNMEGYFMCSTYGTIMSNIPYPDGVATLDPFTENEMADRFWIIHPVFQNFPTGNISFHYTNNDIDDLNEKKLISAQYNESEHVWMTYPVVEVDEMNNFLLTDTIHFASVDHRWTLVGLMENTHIYIPTCFSPNGDGKNDVFAPVIHGNVYEYEFWIFDRWGQLVFYTTDPKEAWDGTFKGEKAQQDVYVVKVTFKNDLNLRQVFIDKVLIIR